VSIASSTIAVVTKSRFSSIIPSFGKTQDRDTSYFFSEMHSLIIDTGAERLYHVDRKIRTTENDTEKVNT